MKYWIALCLYTLSCFAGAEKPITIVTCSYNNIHYYKKQLDSVLDQKYPNYRIIYTDDCSPDGTGAAVEDYLKDHPRKHLVTLIKNTQRNKAMENLWRAIHMCSDDEIIAIVDGDDWLINDKVLEKVNAAYQNSDDWLMYSTYRNRVGRGICISRPLNEAIVEKQGIRGHPFIFSHLRTFYAGLFKRIKLIDLMFQGQFVNSAYDVAIGYPMLEMAYGHIQFLNQPLYIYNNSNAIRDTYASQKIVKQRLAKKRHYEPLDSHPGKPDRDIDEVDVVVFSYNRPMQLYAFLESLYKRSKNFRNVEIIYRTGSEDYDLGYEIVKSAFPEAVWTKQKRPPSDFKKLAMHAAFNKESPAEYIAFAVDDIIVKDDFDFKDTLRLLKKTGAYGFFLRLGTHINHSYMAGKKCSLPKHIAIEPGVKAWTFYQGVADFGYPGNVDMTVYKKADIEAMVKNINFDNPNWLEAHWHKRCKKDNLGLCYDTSKIVNIPMNVVSTMNNKHLSLYQPKELLKKFLEGSKIDVDAYYQVVNRSSHDNIKPIFIQR